MKEEIEKQLKLSKKQNKEQRYDYLCSQFNCINYTIKLEKYTNKLKQENKSLQSQLKAKEEMVKIMEKYFELITDLGFDYDGFNQIDSLKSLIDELVRLAKLGRACNTTEPIYVNNGSVYNILHEEILPKGENK